MAARGAPGPATEDIRVRLVGVDAARLVLGGGVVQALHAAPLLQYLLARRAADG